MSLKGLNLRCYSPPVPDLAELWFQFPIDSLSVKLEGDYSHTADGACRVSFGGGDIGFVKPRPDSPNPNVVANEKIASDLGHLLHLPVAPVLIRKPEPNWPNYTALSLVCLPQGRHWDQGVQSPTDELNNALESLRVFWTWIGDVDHNQHGQNLLYEFDGVKYSVVAIDHSYAFGHDGTDPLTAPVSSGYNTSVMESVTTARSLTLNAIIEIDWAKVEDVFMRLVGEILTDTEAKDRLKWLETRKDYLDKLIDVRL
jgi:hypothetical protein